jgi:hypothetical protein
MVTRWLRSLVTQSCYHAGASSSPTREASRRGLEAVAAAVASQVDMKPFARVLLRAYPGGDVGAQPAHLAKSRF